MLTSRADALELLFLAFDGPARWLPRSSARIWHGTRDPAAWEVRPPVAVPLRSETRALPTGSACALLIASHVRVVTC